VSGTRRRRAEFAFEIVVTLLRITPVLDVAGLDLLRRGVALVEVTALPKLLDHSCVDLAALRLPVGLVRSTDTDALIPVDVQPAQRVEQLQIALLAVAGGVGVFDAKDHAAAGVPGVCPVEEGRADESDVRGSGGRGAETDADVGSTGCAEGG